MESISTQVYLAYLQYKATENRRGYYPCSYKTWMVVQFEYLERINQWLYHGA